MLVLLDLPIAATKNNVCWLAEKQWPLGNLQHHRESYACTAVPRLPLELQPVAEFVDNANASSCGRTGTRAGGTVNCHSAIGHSCAFEPAALTLAPREGTVSVKHFALSGTVPATICSSKMEYECKAETSYASGHHIPIPRRPVVQVRAADDINLERSCNGKHSAQSPMAALAGHSGGECRTGRPVFVPGVTFVWSLAGAFSNLFHMLKDNLAAALFALHAHGVHDTDVRILLLNGPSSIDLEADAQRKDKGCKANCGTGTTWHFLPFLRTLTRFPIWTMGESGPPICLHAEKLIVGTQPPGAVRRSMSRPMRDELQSLTNSCDLFYAASCITQVSVAYSTYRTR